MKAHAVTCPEVSPLTLAVAALPSSPTAAETDNVLLSVTVCSTVSIHTHQTPRLQYAPVLCPNMVENTYVKVSLALPLSVCKTIFGDTVLAVMWSFFLRFM